MELISSAVFRQPIAVHERATAKPRPAAAGKAMCEDIAATNTAAKSASVGGAANGAGSSAATRSTVQWACRPNTS